MFDIAEELKAIMRREGNICDTKPGRIFIEFKAPQCGVLFFLYFGLGKRKIIHIIIKN